MDPRHPPVVPFAAQSFPIGSASVVGASKFEGGAEVGYTLERVLVASLGRPQTWDRGKELSAHAQFSIASGVKVYFADPKSPWQRGTNENTNGLLRQYFPKGTDLSRWSADEIAAIAHTLNT